MAGYGVDEMSVPSDFILQGAELYRGGMGSCFVVVDVVVLVDGFDVMVCVGGVGGVNRST